MSKASKIYRNAAKMIDTEMDFSCLAVGIVARHMGEPAFIYVDAYEKLFFPPEHLNEHAFISGDAWGNAWGDTTSEIDGCRVLALLFMSELVKGE